jgi:hypothetical protein
VNSKRLPELSVSRPFRRICCVVLTLCCLFAFASTGLAEDDIILRTSIAPKDSIWVGQQVILFVDVLGRDGWAQIKKMHSFEIKGAHVLRVQTQGTRLSESIEGVSYSGQRYEVLLFPQRAGEFTVPAISLDVGIKSWGDAAKNDATSMESAPFDFKANVPPGAEGLRGVISTKRLAASQKWNPESDVFKVGDAVKRSIVFEADDVSGMAFLPIRHEEIDGARIYPESPSVNDRVDRGDLISGKRMETVTYVFEKKGVARLPDIKLTWWDLDDSELKKVNLPGMTLNIAPAPVAANAAEQEDRVYALSGALAWVLPLVAVALLVTCRCGAIKRRWREWSVRRCDAETAYFHRFRKAAGSGTAKVALSELMRWLDRIHDEPALLNLFIARYGDESLRRECEGMVSVAMEQDSANWNGRRVVRAMAVARKRWQRTQRHRSSATKILPELNPGSVSGD